jgi:hypothetical protein
VTAPEVVASVRACGGDLLVVDGRLAIAGRSRVPEAVAELVKRHAPAVRAYLAEAQVSNEHQQTSPPCAFHCGPAGDDCFRCGATWSDHFRPAGAW